MQSLYKVIIAIVSVSLTIDFFVVSGQDSLSQNGFRDYLKQLQFSNPGMAFSLADWHF